MKVYITKVYIFFVILVAAVFSMTCSRKDKGDFLAPDEAKIEIRTASREITAKLDELMETPAMQVLDYLRGLLSGGPKGSSVIKPLSRHDVIDTRSLAKLLQHAKAVSNQKGGNGKYQGLYRYNFNSSSFDLIYDSVTYLEYLFPADEHARESHMINAALTITNLNFNTFTFNNNGDSLPEDFFTMADITLVLNSQAVLSCKYRAAFNEHAMPSSIELTIENNPYQLRMSLSGSGQNYSSTMLLKNDNTHLMNYNFSIRYNNDKDKLSRLTGTLQITPVRLEGNMNLANMEPCDDSDIACLNESMDITVVHSGRKKKIGRLEYRAHPEPAHNENPREIHIIYEDGSSEPLADIFNPDLETIKYWLRYSEKH